VWPGQATTPWSDGGIAHVQGPPLADLSLAEFAHPIDAYTRTNFLTAKAAARHMVRHRSGVILTLSTPGARLSGPGFLGYGVTCAAIEAFSRIPAGELGPDGVRVVCLRPHAIPEAVATSYVREVFPDFAERSGAGTVDASAMTGAIANLTCGSLVD
jgi:3-oxoacyl-[acyl-carrier protein] reductase